VPLFFDGGRLALQGQLDGLAGEFAGSRDSGGFDTGEDLSVGSIVSGLLELSSQEKGLFEDECFQRSVCFKGTAHEDLLQRKSSP
jgi:hypothetical protein